MTIFCQICISAALLVSTAAISYNYFVLVPKQHAFENCLSSFDNEWEEFLTSKILVSPADFCSKGYGFIEFIRLAKLVREEARAQYADPDNYAVERRIDEDAHNRLRAKITNAY